MVVLKLRTSAPAPGASNTQPQQDQGKIRACIAKLKNRIPAPVPAARRFQPRKDPGRRHPFIMPRLRPRVSDPAPVPAPSKDVDMSSSPEASSPESDALAKLQREAEEDPENIDLPMHSRFANHPSFGPAGTQLREWRNSSKSIYTPKKELSDTEMHDMFPSINPPPGPSKPKLNRWKAHQVRQVTTKSKSKPKRRETKEANAISDMGLFSMLPGELRNYIYRLAFVPDPKEQPVLISGSDLVCGTGACVHKRASIAAPGIASTCQQIRNELMPIYCAENVFKFDAVMVRNRCVGNWAKSMNTYARMVRKVTLELLVLTRNAPGGGTGSQLCDIVVECPAGRADGRFEVSFDANIPKEKVEACGLKGLMERLNDGEAGAASKLSFIVGSDELAELVFRCRK